MNRYKPYFNEDITIPLNKGDSFLWGKWKNKSAVYDSHYINDKGDPIIVTDTGKEIPMCKIRLLTEELNNYKDLLNKTIFNYVKTQKNHEFLTGDCANFAEGLIRFISEWFDKPDIDYYFVTLYAEELNHTLIYFDGSYFDADGIGSKKEIESRLGINKAVWKKGDEGRYNPSGVHYSKIEKGLEIEYKKINKFSENLRISDLQKHAGKEIPACKIRLMQEAFKNLNKQQLQNILNIILDDFDNYLNLFKKIEKYTLNWKHQSFSKKEIQMLRIITNGITKLPTVIYRSISFSLKQYKNGEYNAFLQLKKYKSINDYSSWTSNKKSTDYFTHGGVVSNTIKSILIKSDIFIDIGALSSIYNSFSIYLDSINNNDYRIQKLQDFISDTTLYDENEFLVFNIKEIEHLKESVQFSENLRISDLQKHAGKEIPACKIRLIQEAKQVGIVYHYTNYENLLNILQDDMLMIGNHNYISLTRNKKNNKNGLQVQIVIDGNKLSNNYKIEPFDYFDMEYAKKHPIGYSGEDEQEERVLTKKIKDLHKYILKINIMFNASVFFYQMGKSFDPQEYIEQLKFYKPNDSLKIELFNFPKNTEIITENKFSENIRLTDLQKHAGASDFTKDWIEIRRKIKGPGNKSAKLKSMRVNRKSDYIIFIFKSKPTYDAISKAVNPSTMEIDRNVREYTQYLKIKDFFKLAETKPGYNKKEMTRKEIKEILRVADLQVFCDDPSFHWQGDNYIISLFDGSLYPTNIAPEHWKGFHNDDNFLCKHLSMIINSIDFFLNPMSSMINKYLKGNK
jgi:hypothetical protein